MKAILLNGSIQGDRLGERVVSTLTAQLQSKGWDVETIVLRDKKISNCAGDFFCWVRSPGMCHVDDDNRTIAAAIIHSDLMVYLTPVTFGGYSSTLKRMVDHQIQNISPFFAQVEGETHHQRRYAHYPDFLAVGWMDAPNPGAEAIFRHLVERNTINVYAQKSYCGLAYANQSEEELSSLAESWLGALAGGKPSPTSALPAVDEVSAASIPAPRRTILLVGSPRTQKSTSHSLASYLGEQLTARGIETETIQVYTTLNNPEKMRSLLASVDTADLVVLTFPLYVDSLPAPVINLLERIAVHRAAQPSQTRFAAIANCGFPEPTHNTTALTICAEFAHQSGFAWAGGLSLGAGEGLVRGVPLNDLDRRVFTLKKALDLSAESLSRGESIPQAARDLLSKPIIPAWMYRLMGGFGWKQQAKQFGAGKLLRQKTYLVAK